MTTQHNVKTAVYQTAEILGCSPDNTEEVWQQMAEFPLPLNAKSFVHQVADAMEMLDMPVQRSAIARASSLL